MKTFFAIILGLVCLFAVTARAQTPTYASQTLGTFLVTASTATNIAYVIDCRKQANVTIFWKNTGHASSTGAAILNLSYSVDGINYETASRAISLASAGTTQNVATNLSTYNMGYIKLNYLTNADGGYNLTNTLSYAVKISAP